MGFFAFHYNFPKNAGDIKLDLPELSEKPLRQHLLDARSLLNDEGIALTSVQRFPGNDDAECPYPVTDAVRAEFRTLAAPRIQRDPTAYLSWLYAYTSHIDIRGLSVGGGKAHRFPIEELYIPLTMAGWEREPRRADKPGLVEVEESAHPELHKALQMPRLVIVGDPGAGKSTFVHRISAALCDSWLGRDPEVAAKRLGLAERPLPVLIRVAELADHLEKRQAAGPGLPDDPHSPDWLAVFLGESASRWLWNLDAGYFRKHFEDGTAILLLDGLDEAPTVAVRERISAIVQQAAATYSRCRFVVTSRPGAYVDSVVLPGFTPARIEPLTDAAVDGFFGKWSEALFHDTPDRVQSHRAELTEALRCRPEIRRLARNPVMLTALAVVHWNERRMPEQRVDLYESIMKWLALSRESKPDRLSPDLTLERMAELALAMQDAEGGRKRQAPRRWAAEQIAHHWYDLPEQERVPAAERFLLEEELDSGIVVGRGGEVLFWHLTFQEYLAACALAALDGEDRNSRLLRQPRKLYASEWRETVALFAMEFRKRRGERLTQQMVGTILDNLEADAALADQAQCAGLLGAVLRDLTVMRFEPKDPRYPALMERVMAIFHPEKSAAVPIRDAIAAAEALGQAGDPRFANSARAGNWVNLSACDFKTRRGKCPVRLDAYSIGRYPVTVQEYAEFIDAGGYRDEQWWPAGGFGQWSEPREWEEQVAHPTRPVVGVSWFEASAYAKWRGARLPDEAEWERAAAGTEGREYPWGDSAPDERLANWNHNVGAPTPVGVYPSGSTPEGIADLAGNVWEWCENWYNEETKSSRVLRGGSWADFSPEYLSCAYRRNFAPDFRLYDVGFRCVWVGLASAAG
ncbi:MAG: SUMF1/EgtB/PvdO family nonheme iron enzyme [Verrucomicrobiales bacterium]|nr:SUMF1/EgtB/PvdO family nonheme iron enzyme [Verrucomicrobiales bacterium]